MGEQKKRDLDDKPPRGDNKRLETDRTTATSSLHDQSSFKIHNVPGDGKTDDNARVEECSTGVLRSHELLDDNSSFKDLETGSSVGSPSTGWPPEAFDLKFAKGDWSQDAPSKLPNAPVAHDLGDLSYHRTLEEFGRKLQEAAEATMTTRRKSNYTRVTALLIHWDHEDTRFVVKIDQLGLAFRQYGFNVERWAIPINNKSHLEVYNKAYELVQEDDVLHLRIIYYLGKAQSSDQGVVWTPPVDSHQSHASPPRVFWTAIQTLLEQAPVDILILLDCARAGVPSSHGGQAVTSLITACAFNTVERRHGDRFAFINVLIKHLYELKKVHSFSTSYLYSRIYLEIQGRSKQSRCSNRELPVHLILSQDHGYPRDILLCAGWEKDRFKKQSGDDIPPKCPSRAGSPTRKGPWHFDNDSSPTPGCNYSPTSLTEVSNQPRLLLSFRLWEDMDPEALKVDLFTQWLGTIPIPVEAVKVEAGFASDSTILLVSTPIYFLPFLPSDPSVSVIGTIHSHNLVPTHPLPYPDISELAISPAADISLLANRVDKSVDGHVICKPSCQGYLDQEEILEGCDVSSEGPSLVCWGRTSLTLIASGPTEGGPGRVVTETTRGKFGETLKTRFWQAVGFAGNHLIAATNSPRLTCYVYDIDVAISTGIELGTSSRVQLPLPRVLKLAVSPDQKSLAFLLEKNQQQGLAHRPGGVDLFQIPVQEFVEHRGSVTKDSTVATPKQLKPMNIGENIAYFGIGSGSSGCAVAPLAMTSETTTVKIILFTPLGITESATSLPEDTNASLGLDQSLVAMTPRSSQRITPTNIEGLTRVGKNQADVGGLVTGLTKVPAKSEDPRHIQRPRDSGAHADALGIHLDACMITCGKRKFTKTFFSQGSGVFLKVSKPLNDHRVLKVLEYHDGATIALATRRRPNRHATYVIAISKESKENCMVERVLAELEGLHNFQPGTDKAAARVTVDDDGKSFALIGVVMDRQWYGIYKVPIPELDNAANP